MTLNLLLFEKFVKKIIVVKPEVDLQNRKLLCTLAYFWFNSLKLRNGARYTP